MVVASTLISLAALCGTMVLATPELASAAPELASAEPELELAGAAQAPAAAPMM